jgi:hypothetical protein
VAERSKTWVFGRSLDGIAVSNPAGGWMSVTCGFCVFKVDVCTTDQSLVQWSPTGCGVFKFDRGTSYGRPRSTRVVEPRERVNET